MLIAQGKGSGRERGLGIGYIPRYRARRDLHNRGQKAPRLCKSRSVLHRGM